MVMCTDKIAFQLSRILSYIGTTDEKRKLEWFQINNINFLLKSCNASNVSKARQIEDFWAILSKLLYNNGWKAKTERRLRLRITKTNEEMEVSVIQHMMCQVKGKLGKIEENGLFSIK